jgi:osmotically inducible protein OsmC
MKAERRAKVAWEGDLMSGSGTIVSSGSGALSNLGVSWTARTEESGGQTSPEELIAAAHAACFSMALSHALAQQGSPPERLDTNAVCSFEKVGDGWKVTTIALEVEGVVRGIDEEAFREAAEGAKDGCPVSGALAGNVEITVSPRLVETVA